MNERIRVESMAKKSESLDGENSNTLTHVIYNSGMLNAGTLTVHILIESIFYSIIAGAMLPVVGCLVDFHI